jgi:hypothetical protein
MLQRSSKGLKKPPRLSINPLGPEESHRRANIITAFIETDLGFFSFQAGGWFSSEIEPIKKAGLLSLLFLFRR